MGKPTDEHDPKAIEDFSRHGGFIQGSGGALVPTKSLTEIMREREEQLDRAAK